MPLHQPCFSKSSETRGRVCFNLFQKKCEKQVKDEPMDIVEDAEWDRALEAEILAANEGFNDDIGLLDNIEILEKKKTRPKRARKPKMRENFETNPDEPDEMSESERFDDEEDFSVSDDDDDDPSFKNSQSDDSDIGDDDSLNSLDMFGKFHYHAQILKRYFSGSDSNSADLSLVKQEFGEGEDEGVCRF